jgi:hypothetical protein
VPNGLPRSYFGPISLLLTHTSLYIRSTYLHSNTLLANRFQVLVARPREEVEVQLADETNAIRACVHEGAKEVVVVDRADEDLRVLNRHGHGLLKGCLGRVAELRKELGLSWIITPLDSFAYFQLAELAFERELPNRETQLLRKLEEAVERGVGRGDFEGG